MYKRQHIVGRILAERFNYIAKFCYYRDLLSVACLSVTRVSCDEITEARITRFSLKSREMSQLERDKLDAEIRRKCRRL